MKKIYFIFIILLGLLLLVGCRDITHHKQLYLNFNHSQEVDYQDNELYWSVNGCVYSTDLNQEVLSMEKVSEIGSFCTIYLHDKEVDLLSYKGPYYGLFVNRLNQNMVPEILYNWKGDELIHRNSPMVLDGDVLYYVKSTAEGYGAGLTLKCVDLSCDDNISALYIWKDSYMGEYNPKIRNMKLYDNYLVMEYESTSENQGIWIYNLKEKSMIIEANLEMLGLSYYNGMFYYMDPTTQQLFAWDLNPSKEPIALTKLQYCTERMTLLCDESYIYISPSNYFDVDSEESNKIWVYNYAGILVDVFDISDNQTARENEYCTRPDYSQVKCSTEKYVFIGDCTYLTPRVLFYVEKDKIGTSDLQVYTLYDRKK